MNSCGGRARAPRRQQPDGAPYSEQRIDYILKTGANWSGPIKDFRLVVDKGEPDSLVSFCGEDVERIEPDALQMRRPRLSSRAAGCLACPDPQAAA